jgi:hypothetical protein
MAVPISDFTVIVAEYIRTAAYPADVSDTVVVAADHRTVSDEVNVERDFLLETLTHGNQGLRKFRQRLSL